MKNERTFTLSMKERIHEIKVLFRSIPSVVVALFIVSVISMNLLANKTIFSREWIAIDGGILVSWISFLSMDIVTMRFGPKAGNRLSILATLINLLACLMFYIASIIPTSDDFSAFNSVLGGTWFILLSSTIAFIASALLNNFLNWTIGKLFKKKGGFEFVARTYISTFISQFFDNLIFATLTFMLFAPIFWDGFSWSFIQCLTCSITGAILELVCEIIFSPIGYKLVRKWEREGVGKEYLELVEKNKNAKTSSINKVEE